MKIITFILMMMVLSFPSIAQQTSVPIEKKTQIGNHFKEFSITAQIGLGVMLAGTIVTAFPTIMPTENRDPKALLDRTKQLTKLGLFLSTGGTLAFVVGLNSARKAGNLMNLQNMANLDVTNDGLTLIIPIN